MEATMDRFIEIIANLGFWAIIIPALSAIIAWFLNERTKRKWEEYRRKEDHYKELLRTLRGFYVETTNTNLRMEFLQQVNLCWLYTPDDVIRKAYAFLDKVHTDANANTNNKNTKEDAVGDLVIAIRKDLLSKKIVKRTELQASDFKHLVAT